MKKILSITLAVLMLSLFLGVNSFAIAPPKQETKYVTFSEDFQKMFYDGKLYSRKNTSGIYFYEDIDYTEQGVYTETYALPNYQATLSDTQAENVDDIQIFSLNPFGSEVIFAVNIYYKDGATLSVSYLRSDYLEEYEKLINKEFDELYVDFGWPEGNIVEIKKDSLSSEITKKFDYWDYYDCFPIEGGLDNGKLRYEYGEIRYINGDFYYYNPELNKEVENYFNNDGYLYEEYSYSYETEPDVNLTKITDEATISTLDEALQKYYEDDMGYMYNDELLEGVSKVFLTILFGIIPFAAFILFLVLAIKAKKKGYRKIYVTGSIVSIAEVIVFIITSIYIFK